MDIEQIYQNFLESQHDGIRSDIAVKSADSQETADLIVDGIEESTHAGFVAGFVAGIEFMKGAVL